MHLETPKPLKSYNWLHVAILIGAAFAFVGPGTGGGLNPLAIALLWALILFAFLGFYVNGKRMEASYEMKKNEFSADASVWETGAYLAALVCGLCGVVAAKRLFGAGSWPDFLVFFIPGVLCLIGCLILANQIVESTKRQNPKNRQIN